MAVVGNHTSQNISSATSSTLSHNNDKYGVIVSAYLDGIGSSPTSITCTYAGVSMTQLGVSVVSAQNGVVVIFFLSGAATGANNAVLSWTNSAQGGIMITSIDASGYRTFVSATGSTSPSTVTAASSISGDYVYGATGNTTDTTLTVGSGQTTLNNTVVAGSLNYASSYEVATGANTVIDWTQAGNRTWAIAAIPFIPYQPSGNSAATSPFFIF